MSWTALARIAAGMILGFAMALAHAETREPPLPSVCFATSDQVRLCYSEHRSGNPSAPLLIFVPGWTMPAAIWERQLAYFSGKYSVVAFDPRGQGASATPDFGYTLERRILDFKELLDRFPGRTFILVGWSLAVLELLAYVEQYGEGRLSGLVLVDNSIGEGPEVAPRTGENPFFAELRSNREETLRKFVDAIFRTNPGKKLKDRVLASALKTNVEDSIRLLSYPQPRTYWKETIYRISKPILYLVTPRWGDQASRLAQHHAGATVNIFDHSGHALFWDEADRFNQVLHDFIRAHTQENCERQ